MERDEDLDASSGGDGDIFEITDFTNATPWESFIADLESLFRQWELARPDHGQESALGGIQHRKTEQIGYSTRRFVVTLEVDGRGKRETGFRKDGVAEWPEALHEMMDSSADFPPRAHHLARWYGLSQFVVVCPTEGAECLHSQAQANLMLSSVSIAITNTGCTTPVFVQLHQPWRLVYVGTCESERVRVNYNVAHLRHTPPPFNHLSGLLTIFKSKIGSAVVSKMDPVRVSVRFLYVLRHWSLDDWPVEPLADPEKGFDNEYLSRLRVGAFTDPVKELHLSAIWPSLTEELVTDTATSSDLDPSHASVWTVSLHLTESASCILAETLLNFYQLCYRNGSVAELLGKASLWDEDSTGAVSDSYSKPLDRLTSPGTTLASPLFHSVVYTATQRMESGRTAEENITERDLEAVIKFLFPDAYDQDTNAEQTTKTTQGESDLVVKLKSAPLDSLTCRLAKALAIVNTECGVKAMCKVWHEVTLELRYRWENGILLPHIPEGPPDMKCCMLHQKLQMLDCSIRHKIKHSQQHSQRHQQPLNPSPTPNHISSSSHQLRTAQESQDSLQTTTTTTTTTVPHSATENRKAGVGREGQRGYQPPESQASITKLTDIHSDPRLSGGETERETRLSGGEMERETVIDDNVAEDDTVAMVTSRHDDNESGNESEDEFFEALETHEEEEEDVSVPSTMGEGRTRREREGEGGGEDKEGGEGEMGERWATETLQCHQHSRERGVKGSNVGSDEKEVTPDSAAEPSEEGLGRLEPCGTLVLIATGEPMYIPITQDQPPLTEDHVWEQQAVMAQLGTSQEAARLRAKMQSSSLISDMQAFKAANPGCLLEDFVRWYSPRDWEEGEDGEECGGESWEKEEGSEEGEEGEEVMECTVEGQEKGEGGEVGNEGEGVMECERQGEGEDGDRETKRLSKFDVECEGERGGEVWGGGEWDVIGEGGEDNNDSEPRTAGEDKGCNDQFSDKKKDAVKKFVSGHLSARMRQPGGVWREVWSMAEPVPVHRQKKLFDDTREAEKVLHYLAGLKVAELGLLVLPVLAHSALHSLRERHTAHPLSVSESHLADTVSLLASIHHPTTDSLPKYKEVISLLSQTEHLQAAAHSLRLKLTQGINLSDSGSHTTDDGERRGGSGSEIEAAIEVLLQEPELVLQEPTASQTGLALRGLLAAQVATRDLEEQVMSRRKIRVSPESFPPPSGREFILRTVIPHPSPLSLPVPQRMYCGLTPNEFRLTGAFTSDTLVT